MFNVDAVKSIDRRAPVETIPRVRWRWAKLPLIGSALLAYTYFYSADLGFIFILNSLLLLTAALLFCLYHKPSEVLSPAKIFTVLYCVSFSLLPFWIVSVGGYRFRFIKDMVPELMDKGSTMALLGYLFFLIGYLVILSVLPKVKINFSQKNLSKSYAIFTYTALLAVGFICFSVIFFKLGGIQHFTSFSEGRADLLAGVYGGYFWGMHLLISGFCIFCVTHIKQFPIMSLALAVMVAALFSILQGRDMVIAPLFCWLVLFDSFKRPLTFKIILLSLFVLLILSSLVGALRGGEMAGDITATMLNFFENALLHVAKLLAANVEQFDTAMTAIKHADINGRVGIMVLMSWFEPIDRALFGNSVHSINSGILIDLLIIPEHKGWNTAASPSILGELYLAFKWLGVTFGLFIVGMFFGLLSRWHDRRERNPFFFSAYPFVLYVCTKMIVDGFQHGFRAILIFVSIYIFYIFMQESKRIHDPKNSFKNSFCS